MRACVSILDLLSIFGVLISKINSGTREFYGIFWNMCLCISMAINISKVALNEVI